MINDFLSKMACFRHDHVYDLLAYQNPKLCLDVGAAAGIITKRIKERTPEDTRVIAFEPFEGNHQYFFDNTKDFRNVELVKKAVSAQAGTARFLVPSVVKGNERGWESMQGYSSAGFLARSSKTVLQGKESQELAVETVAIDEVVAEHVDFMKIDVQGGELEVLKGCENVIRTYGLDVMYIEFGGDKRIIDLLTSLGYTIFDTDYLIISNSLDQALLQEMGFYDFQGTRLSTGKSACKARLRLSDQDYCSFLLDFRQKYGSIQTDLVCVSDGFLDTFLLNLSDFARNQPVGDRPHQPFIPTPVPAPIPTLAATASSQSSIESSSVSSSVKKSSNGAVAAAPKVAVPKVQASSPREQESSSSPAIALIKRIVRYYSRWPMVLAILAIALNLAAFQLDESLRGAALSGSTMLLLLLIAHAASKADYVLSEVSQARTDQQRAIAALDTRLSKKVSRLRQKIRPKSKV